MVPNSKRGAAFEGSRRNGVRGGQMILFYLRKGEKKNSLRDPN